MSEESVENITKSDLNFTQTLFDQHLLPDMNLNGHFNISIPKKVMNLYISHTLGIQFK